MTTEAQDLIDPERSYRRGYTHGAWEVIDFVRDKLPVEDLQRLQRWFVDGAREWRMEAYRGESTRKHDREITYHVQPPKIGWPY